MCSDILKEKLSDRGIATKIFFESHAGIADRVRQFLPCGKVLLLADESEAKLMGRLRGCFAGFRVLCVLFGKTDKAAGLFSLPDDVRMVVAAGERSAAAARFFCTLRGAFCIVLPLSPTARGLFCRESTEGNYPVKEPDAVLFDEQIARADRALALAETALCAVLADDTDIDAAFTGERREKGYSFLRTAESLCESAASPREIFAASTVYHLALREFSAYPAFIFARLAKERFSLSEGAAAFHALRFFAAQHVQLFSAGKLRPYFVADYPARLERAAKAAGKEAFSALRIPTAEECFSRAGIFSECREHFALAAGLTAHFVQSVSERYFLFGGAKEQFFAEGAEELYELAADLSPLYSVGAIERDFGAAPARRARAAGSIDAKRAFSSPSLSAERTGARDLSETDARSGSERAIG